MKAYSKEFRREVLSAFAAGQGTCEVAKRFGVSESWVRRIKQVRREIGKTAPATKRRRVPTWVAEADRIRAAITAHSPSAQSMPSGNSADRSRNSSTKPNAETTSKTQDTATLKGNTL